MKVSAINYQPTKFPAQKIANLKKVSVCSPENTDCLNPSTNNVSFKRVKWGGFLGSTIGTFAGLGLGTLVTLGTGGIAAPLLLSMFGAASGGIGGDIIDSKINKNYPHDDD